MAGSFQLRTVRAVSTYGSPGMLPPADDPLVSAEEEWVDDPFADPGLDDSGDEQLAELFAKANTAAAGNRHHLSALSALSAQMDGYRPLSPAEQAERIAAYNDGLAAAARLAAGGRMSGSARDRLERAVDAGERAQTELVGSMFRLVLVIARELASNRYGRERSLDVLPDIVADANLALVEAVSKYDPGRGPAFSVYAGRVIRERVRASLGKSGLIDIPASWLRVRRLATTLAPELTVKLGRAPSTEEMQAGLRAQCMAWAADHLTDDQQSLPEPVRVELMKAKLTKQGMLGAIERYDEVMQATQQLWNLDAPLTSDGGTTLGDVVADAGSDATFDAVELSQLRDALLAALASLPERDREIVLYRFGFADGEVWTYAKLAPRYDISAERVRQIERAVLGKLRGPGFEALSSYLPSSLD